MSDRKSQRESPLAFFSSLLTDIHLQLETAPHECAYDIRTVESRLGHEGLGFATKVLPSLGKAIDRSFETGVLEVPNGFRTQRNSKIPVFGRGIFQLVYGADGGFIADPNEWSTAQYWAIAGLRQLCFGLYKLETSVTDHQRKSKTKDFVDVDDSLPRRLALDTTLLDASQLLEELLVGLDPRDIVPRHGPGAVATGERCHEKYFFSRKYPTLHEYFPMWEYMSVDSSCELRDHLLWDKELIVADPVARLAFVPKDSRGPRTISLEPLEIQWIQGGIRERLYGLVEHHPLTRGHVNFTNQDVNRGLARDNSVTRIMATVDLKDASDRVSYALVEAIFPENLFKHMDACRSVATMLPDGSTHQLKKFSPMGSALCFPVESLVFWAICVSVVTRARWGENFSHFDVSDVYVYGDDLVVPSAHVAEVIEGLEAYGLVVNREKTYSAGFFRESCGGEYLCGRDVSVTRIKHYPVADSRVTVNPSKLLPNLADAANAFQDKGFWRVAATLRDIISEGCCELPAGVGPSAFPCIRQRTYQDAHRYNRRIGVKSRWNRSFQRVEYRVLTVTTEGYEMKLDGWEGLIRALTIGCGDDPDHWAVPRRTTLSYRWCAL